MTAVSAPPALNPRDFLAIDRQLSDEELRYLCEIDQETHFAIGALREGARRGSPAAALASSRSSRAVPPDFLRTPTSKGCPHNLGASS